MSKVSAETPSKIQQSVIGTDATKPVGRGFATGRGAVRIDSGWRLHSRAALPLNLTVAFIGLSGLAPMRAVSLRGAAGAVTEAGGGGNEAGRFQRRKWRSKTAVFASEFDGMRLGGRAIGGAGGRLGDEPAAGGMGFGATNGGRRPDPERGTGEGELGAGGRVAAAEVARAN